MAAFLIFAEVFTLAFAFFFSADIDILHIDFHFFRSLLPRSIFSQIIRHLLSLIRDTFFGDFQFRILSLRPAFAFAFAEPSAASVAWSSAA
jgi:hypothetical protein